MHRTYAVLFVILTASSSARSEPGTILRETWYESRTSQGKLGYLHFLAREVEQNGRKLIHTTLREQLSYDRSGDPYTEMQEQYTIETRTGEVVELGYRTNLSKKQQVLIRGRVNGDKLLMQAFENDQPTPYTLTIPWDKTAIGLYASDSFFQGKKLALGDVFQFKEYSVAADRVVTTTSTVKEITDHPPFPPLAKGGTGGVRRVRVDQTYPKETYLDKLSLWLDEHGSVVKLEEDTPLFGQVAYARSSEARAMAPVTERVGDKESLIAVNQPLKLKERLPKELIVRVFLEGDDEPGTVFAKDARQQVVRADNEKVEMRLRTTSVGRAAVGGVEPPKEYLGTNFFIRANDALVRQRAKEAVGEERDRRKQVHRIRRWMRAKFNGNYEIPFATADEVAKTLEGDCSEMGILSAAMCRAVGIPSRVAFGVVYDPANPGFSGHLWTEVFLDGDWEPFDPTGILNQVGAAYIKIADYSMNEVLNPDALSAVRRAFRGRMKIDIIEIR